MINICWDILLTCTKFKDVLEKNVFCVLKSHFFTVIISQPLYRMTQMHKTVK